MTTNQFLEEHELHRKVGSIGILKHLIFSHSGFFVTYAWNVCILQCFHFTLIRSLAIKGCYVMEPVHFIYYIHILFSYIMKLHHYKYKHKLMLRCRCNCMKIAVNSSVLCLSLVHLTFPC
jgi:hypothetical protein